MTLEEMQHVWSEMTDRIDAQKRLTDKLILDMKREKFKNKIVTIFRYEFLGAIVCFLAALVITINFGKLDTWYLQGSGIFVLLYFILMPIIVLQSIHQMRRIDLFKNTYKEYLLAFTKKRKRFLFWQRTALLANFLLIVLILPVFSKLFSGKNLFLDGNSIWAGYSIVMLALLIPFSFWGYTKYKRMTFSAEKLLQLNGFFI